MVFRASAAPDRLAGRASRVTAPTVPRTAMVLAAGLGTRLRPLTDMRPKPLIEVADRTLLDRTIDRLAEAGVTRFVINLHHLADQLESHVQRRAAADPGLDFLLSDERDALLDTGGGIVRALPLLRDPLFFAVNADMIWLDANGNSLQALARRWAAGTGPAAGAGMQALLLLHPTVSARGYAGNGDFTMSGEGRLTRRGERNIAPFLYTGVQILQAGLFAGCDPGRFSLNRLYDRAIERGSLFGLRHEGLWVDAGHPDGLATARRLVSRLERDGGQSAAA